MESNVSGFGAKTRAPRLLQWHRITCHNPHPTFRPAPTTTAAAAALTCIRRVPPRTAQPPAREYLPFRHASPACAAAPQTQGTRIPDMS